MKKIVLTLSAVVLMFAMTACGDPVANPSGGDSGTYAPNEPGGIGMTYNGKMGYDLGGGLVLPYDGSGVQLGYGF